MMVALVRLTAGLPSYPCTPPLCWGLAAGGFAHRFFDLDWCAGQR